MAWCLGSGVPGDPLCGRHEVPPEWEDVAWRDHTFERKDRGDRVYVGTRPRCRLCEQTREDYRKNLNRDQIKARNTISSHARRYAKSTKWNCAVEEARRRLGVYGWNVEVIVELFRAARAAGSCSGCGWEWDYGEHEMTLDIEDPSALPLLPSNVAVICRTCNTRKQAMSVGDWRAFKAYAEAMRAGAMGRQLALGATGGTVAQDQGSLF